MNPLRASPPAPSELIFLQKNESHFDPNMDSIIGSKK